MHCVECSQEELEALAATFAEQVASPVTFLLWGEMGAGKSTFARAFIRAYFQNPELPVPSPTFTLVQFYDANPGQGARKRPIWHIDLYRLESASETEELGLYEAFENDICLVEWPDRLPNTNVPHRVDLTFTVVSHDRRRLEWSSSLEKSLS